MSPLSKLSLVQLVSVALGVVLLPPVVALFVAAVAVEDLATSGSTTVRDAVHTVELTHGLVEQVTALERIARQRQILGDGDLKTRHLERREELVSVIGELDGLELPASLHERLDALQQQEHDLHAVLATAEPTSASYDAAVNELGALGDTALVLQRGAYEALRADARDLQSRAGRMQDRLMLLGWLAVPLAVGFVFTVLFGVVRPLRSLGAAIEIDMRLTGAGWPIESDPSELEAAILNMALNSRDAMADSGRLTIELSDARLDGRAAAAIGQIAPGDYVLISLRDTGHGMPAEVVERVFEPFFTAKPAGQGNGLGLSI